MATEILPSSDHELAERFFRYAKKGDDVGCWIWTGGKTPAGYGLLWTREQKQRSIHRVSWELHFGNIPDGLWVLHKCDNPSCWRPDHLFLGTPKDNFDDMVAKGRKRNRPNHPNHLRGERHPISKLTEDDVRQIRKLLSPLSFKRGPKRDIEKLSHLEIALRFGVSERTIFNILHGKIWTHVS